MPDLTPPRPRSTLLGLLLLWIAFYASFTLITPPLLDDADSVHAEVAREMLLRHDFITLHANGIRYLEKAPLLYWSMAACMRASQLAGRTSPQALTVAARIPLALTVLALALLADAFARRLFRSARSGLYAALILLSSFGIFLFTRITIPDGMVCLFTTLALYCFWRTEEAESPPLQPGPWALDPRTSGFAAACALNVLTKGLIGIVFPVAITVLYLLMTRGLRGALNRLRQLHLGSALLVFLAIAAPWHILAGLANPAQGHPAPFAFTHGHWQVPLPTDGNVRGWFWFYFMNEHLLRYLNLRVPHDYDTAPLWLFWGLCLLWLMPWSAFAFHATWEPIAQYIAALRVRLQQPARLRAFYTPDLRSGRLFLVTWAAFALLFFALSTRQEYYVLPALPALALLIAGWLAHRATDKPEAQLHRRAAYRCTAAVLVFGTLFAAAALFFLLKMAAPTPNADLATLLNQNPSDYALSMGHFLDLTGPALALFRLPLTLAALSLFVFPLASLLLRKQDHSAHPIRLFITVFSANMFPRMYKAWAGRRRQVHAANLALAAGAFGFLLAAHLGLQTFAPVLTSAQLAQAIAPQVQPADLIVIHGEYESGSTLGFTLQRDDLRILEGRSSNLWYGSFFPDAPKIFETNDSLAQRWASPQRVFLWQSLTDDPKQLPPLPTPVYILVKSGGKEILSNQPNH